MAPIQIDIDYSTAHCLSDRILICLRYFLDTYIPQFDNLDKKVLKDLLDSETLEKIHDTYRNIRVDGKISNINARGIAAAIIYVASVRNSSEHDVASHIGIADVTIRNWVNRLIQSGYIKETKPRANGFRQLSLL